MGSGFFFRSVSKAPLEKKRGGLKEPGIGGFGRARRGLVSKEKSRKEGLLVNVFFIFVRIDSLGTAFGASALGG
jgi:hypothetical protein